VRTLQEGGTPEAPIYASARMRQEAARGARTGAQPDREGLSEHVATENILRALDRVDKRGGLDYTADEYVEALQEARGGPRTLFAFGWRPEGAVEPAEAGRRPCLASGGHGHPAQGWRDRYR
jgi:hypothetical protein